MLTQRGQAQTPTTPRTHRQALARAPAVAPGREWPRQWWSLGCDGGARWPLSELPFIKLVDSLLTARLSPFLPSWCCPRRPAAPSLRSGEGVFQVSREREWGLDQERKGGQCRGMRERFPLRILRGCPFGVVAKCGRYFSSARLFLTGPVVSR